MNFILKKVDGCRVATPAVELDCADSPVRVIDRRENQREMGEGWHQWTGSGTTRGNKPTLL